MSPLVSEPRPRVSPGRRVTKLALDFALFVGVIVALPFLAAARTVLGKR